MIKKIKIFLCIVIAFILALNVTSLYNNTLQPKIVKKKFELYRQTQGIEDVKITNIAHGYTWSQTKVRALGYSGEIVYGLGGIQVDLESCVPTDVYEYVYVYD